MLFQRELNETLNSSGCACVAWSNKLRTTLAPNASVTASGTLRTGTEYCVVSAGEDSAARLAAGENPGRRANEASRNTIPCARTEAEYRTRLGHCQAWEAAAVARRRGTPAAYVRGVGS